jgi:hypothetical protein
VDDETSALISRHRHSRPTWSSRPKEYPRRSWIEAAVESD